MRGRLNTLYPTDYADWETTGGHEEVGDIHDPDKCTACKIMLAYSKQTEQEIKQRN